ncbi:MAG: hypothetical protein FJ189_10945 [Gammaproteobacteria bacterium]|nr:hypothetical protein [Gammaproteobacteria bacterium]
MPDTPSPAHDRDLGDAARRRAPVPLGLIAWIAVFSLFPVPAAATDLGAWVQKMEPHERWHSVEFRDPYSGKFLVSRAGTEDTRARATLTLTASPLDACLPDVVIVFERDAPAVADLERSEEIQLQIDRRPPTRVPVRIVTQQRDRFEFVQFESLFDTRNLAGHRVLRVRKPPELRAEFSLRGFAGAWQTALSLCQNFLPVD